MSNFICSECGMTNIDCGGAGYKTPKEIELENQIADLGKKVERLQEQLNDANEVIKKCADYCSVSCYYDERDEEIALDSKAYLKKWGVK